MSKDVEPGAEPGPAGGRRRWLTALGAGLGLVVVGLLVICWIIASGVRAISDKALREYSGDRVTATMALLDSERNSFHDRNHAIWALGQLGDPRALPVLEKYLTGVVSVHDDQTRELSQYELKKAIAACQGSFNLGAMVWRHGDLAPSAVARSGS